MKQGYLTCLSLGNYGRFMNGGFQIAGILGIAKKNNLEPVFPKWINYDHRDRFGSEEDVDLYKHFVHELPPVPDGVQWQPERFIDWGFHDVVLPPGNWNLSGHFQSPRYFEDCLDQIHHYFRMKDEPPQNDYVAIHVRLGDYDNNYHPRLDMRYYGPAMARFPGERFLIFSDDITSAQQMAPAMLRYSQTIDYAVGDYIEDFALMKKCKLFIIGNSSYSAMAAILGEHPEKQVIAPRPWFGPAAQINGEDVYLKDWTVIDWE